MMLSITTIRAATGAALAAILIASVGCDSKSRGQRQTASSADEDNVAAAPDGGGNKASTASTNETTDPPKASDLARFTDDIEGTGALVATIETSLGVVACELYAERAPLTVANFVGLATGKKAWVDPQTGELRRNKPFYDGVEFHRVIPNFLVQVGDRTGTGAAGPGYTIPDEFHPTLRHDEPGMLSMANKGKPDSAGSQWFITETPIPHLDNRHSVFGQCEDLDVVKKIARVPTGPQNRPKEPPRIESISFSREPAKVTAE